MATINVNINVHHHGLERIESKLNRLIILNKKQMASIQELTQKVADLQQAVNDEQQEIANALGALQTEVQSLKDIIAAGGAATAEELQVVVDNINGIIEDVKSTIPNLPDPEPTPEG